jgi:hypothetical protein
MQLTFIEETGDRSGLWEESVRHKIRQRARLYTLEDQISRHPFAVLDQQRNPILASGIEGSVREARKHSKGKRTTADFEESRNLRLGTDGAKKGRVAVSSCQVLPMESTGYEKARITFDADILQLSALTSIHLGKGASFIFGQGGRSLWKSIEKSPGPSYLDFIPLYYDQSNLVRTAADCVLARLSLSAIQQSNTQSQAHVLRLYGVALSQLQQAINNPKRRMGKDVLLAMSILQLYEVRITTVGMNFD